MNLPWKGSCGQPSECGVRCKRLKHPLKLHSPSKEGLIENHCVKHFYKFKKTNKNKTEQCFKPY